VLPPIREIGRNKRSSNMNSSSIHPNETEVANINTWKWLCRGSKLVEILLNNFGGRDEVKTKEGSRKSFLMKCKL